MNARHVWTAGNRCETVAALPCFSLFLASRWVAACHCLISFCNIDCFRISTRSQRPSAADCTGGPVFTLASKPLVIDLRGPDGARLQLGRGL